MTDPIGTAQERELITRLRKYGHIEAADALSSRIAEVERLTARVNELEAVLAETLPKNLCLTNKNVRDDAIVSIDCTMGELRNISATLSQHRKL